VKRIAVIAALAAASLATAQGVDHSYLVGGAFGAGSYEAYTVAGGAVERSYEVGFHMGGDFYRNDGRVTHLVSFDYFSTQDYYGVAPIKIFDFTYNVPVFLTSGPLRPAACPFFGARFATSRFGGSLGELGVLGGVRYKPSPDKCIFSDVFFGWRGRYGSLDYERATETDGWKSSLIFRNANTVEIFLPLCIYITAALDYDFYDVGTADPDFPTESRKPVFSGGFGPAFYF
jgi:hypothetical protein